MHHQNVMIMQDNALCRTSVISPAAARQKQEHPFLEVLLAKPLPVTQMKLGMQANITVLIFASKCW